ncbi:MAG: N-acetylmuramoyl-L-alanine amidase-like domain-containing protein [Bacteroidota bacterium]
MRTFTLIIVLILSASVQAQSVLDSALYTQADADIFEDIIARFSSQSEQPVGVLIPEIGRYFLGDTYVSHTLEVSDKEQLILNLREMDCTTYAENLFALARTLKSEQHTFEQFAKELTSIRYRNGILNQYPSRLHYFSDWIYSNRDQQLVSTPADSFGQPFPNVVNFMSTHPDSYRHLSDNSEFVGTIKEQESEINSSSYWYIPKESIATYEADLQEGDIIGLTTSIKGLDVAHVGVIVEVNGRMHLMHASQSNQKVEISKEPISSFLKPESKNTGIMVARPLDVENHD